jgi:hypothetical protein
MTIEPMTVKKMTKLFQSNDSEPPKAHAKPQPVKTYATTTTFPNGSAPTPKLPREAPRPVNAPPRLPEPNIKPVPADASGHKSPVLLPRPKLVDPNPFPKPASPKPNAGLAPKLNTGHVSKFEDMLSSKPHPDFATYDVPKPLPMSRPGK